MKKQVLLFMAVLAPLSLKAQQYYVIGSDSNNCQVHRHHTKKGFVYITGSDCLCIKKDETHLANNWIEDFGKVQNRMGCYPERFNFNRVKSLYHTEIKDCDGKTHCSQFDCLQSYFYDNATYSAAQSTISKSDCVDEDRQPLDLCDVNGQNCHQ